MNFQKIHENHCDIFLTLHIDMVKFYYALKIKRHRIYYIIMV